MRRALQISSSKILLEKQNDSRIIQIRVTFRSYARKKCCCIDRISFNNTAIESRRFAPIKALLADSVDTAFFFRVG